MIQRLKRVSKAAVGKTPFWEAVALFRARGVAVVTYHRVGAADDPYPHVDIDVFRGHVEWAARKCRLIGPDELRRQCEHPGSRRAVLLTFDDGFRGYYDHVYPLLKRMGIPSVVFVTTGLVDDPASLLWADTVYMAVLRGRRPRLSLPWRPHDTYDLADPTSRARFLKAFKAHVKNVPDAERQSHVGWLVGATGHEPAGTRQMLTWDEIRATLPLTTYGGHSHTHPILSQLRDERIEEEVRLCRERLERETGATPTLFAYPNGRHADFDERCRKAVARNGFTTAFTTEPGINGPYTDWLAVRRLPGEVAASHFPWLVAGLKTSPQRPRREAF